MFYPKYEKTVDGHEMTWQSNYLGHFLLTHLLLPALEKAEKARIVIVASKLHLLSKSLDLETIDDAKKYGFIGFAQYNRSKLANKRIRSTFLSTMPELCSTPSMRRRSMGMR
ncbi:hypothetical protein TELCIR_17451 [Teladorsagia circumcincta]|uniref:Uncharacterized protein n=1 Tax=Teladorsagia circumcincta TaxID=45464 RepID=A0A2G9TSR3_TELCI|nr:hypothetical protein TELCIR_17451 [Teladorsagia circumcincta]